MIRMATATDCVMLAQLDGRCHVSTWSAKQFQVACESARDEVWLSVSETGECRGFIVWQTMVDEIELHLLVTAPESRRQGLARMLLAQMFQAACQQNIRRIVLEVRASNVAAQNLYRQQGFVQIAQRKRYYHDSEDALIMEKIC